MRDYLSATFQKLNAFNKLMLLLNMVFVLALLISYSAPFISPKTSVFFAYMGLAYPIFAGVNLIFCIYWVLWRKHVFLYSAAAIMLGLLSFSRTFQFTIFQPSSDQDQSLRVMSFNVRLFDLYNWTGNLKSKDQIQEFIKNEDVDVVCFQEYYRGVGVHFSVREFLENEVGYGYCFEHITTSAREKNGIDNNLFGSAIFSKYPFIDSGYVVFENDENNHISWIDIVKANDTVRIINAHIGSMRLQNADYQLIGGNDNKIWSYQKQAEQDIFTRMTRGFYRRTEQLEVLKVFIDQTPHRMVLCVDLNDTPNSFAYNQVVKDLNDAFMISGSGIGSTYVGENIFNRIMPINRIDYIFHSKGIDSRNFTTHKEKLSDHKAISCEIWF
ncbi:MAG: endonuclease/exonuclease/phosphatase family protein [Flavobacteriales bacterium]|nr:endonuclease/exonuclease/phosphatase family protein [Flavobacteriales bacterium]